FDELVKRKAVVSYLLLTKTAGSGEYTHVVIVEVASPSAAEGTFQRELEAASQAVFHKSWSDATVRFSELRRFMHAELYTPAGQRPYRRHNTGRWPGSSRAGRRRCGSARGDPTDPGAPGLLQYLSSRDLQGRSSRGRTRTCDPPVNSRLLYQLSYSGRETSDVRPQTSDVSVGRNIGFRGADFNRGGRP